MAQQQQPFGFETPNQNGGIALEVEEEKKPNGGSDEAGIVSYPKLPPVNATGATQQQQQQQQPQQTIKDSYEVKRIEFLGKKLPILMQSKNGPCPLLAIANRLLLANMINIHENTQDVSLDNLVHLIAERILDTNPLDDSSHSENRRKAVADAIDTLPKMSRGLDVNVKFEDVDKFEFDWNIGVFDMLGVNLYHGWVIDPLDEAYASLLPFSYNTLIERVVAFDSKFGNDDVLLTSSMDNPELRKLAGEGEVAQRFLNAHASQLTYTGLAKLHEKVKERELCVFFRNNHFSTMFKYEGHLYLLCTDSGFNSRSAVAWERLTDINGDTELCSPTFGDPNAFLSADDALQEISADEALAQQLQIEEQMKHESVVRGAQPPKGNNAAALPPQPPAGNQPKKKYNIPPSVQTGAVLGPAKAQIPTVYALTPVDPSKPMSSDEALARQLQMEDDHEARRIHARNAQEQKEREKKNSSGCLIS